MEKPALMESASREGSNGILDPREWEANQRCLLRREKTKGVWERVRNEYLGLTPGTRRQVNLT